MYFWGHQIGSPRKRGLRGLVVQSLLREPKNGAELIADMDRMTHGWWRPSPGSVYPLLEELLKEGVAQKRADGRYELTPGYRDSVSWSFGAPPRSVHDTITEINGLTSYLEDLGREDPDALREAKGELDSVVGRLKGLAKQS